MPNLSGREDLIEWCDTEARSIRADCTVVGVLHNMPYLSVDYSRLLIENIVLVPVINSLC